MSKFLGEIISLVDKITTNSEVLIGKPTIRGLRISVDQVLKSLAVGLSAEEVRED